MLDEVNRNLPVVKVVCFLIEDEISVEEAMEMEGVRVELIDAGNCEICEFILITECPFEGRAIVTLRISREKLAATL